MHSFLLEGQIKQPDQEQRVRGKQLHIKKKHASKPSSLYPYKRTFCKTVAKLRKLVLMAKSDLCDVIR